MLLVYIIRVNEIVGRKLLNQLLLMWYGRDSEEQWMWVGNSLIISVVSGLQQRVEISIRVKMIVIIIGLFIWLLLVCCGQFVVFIVVVIVLVLKLVILVLLICILMLLLVGVVIVEQGRLVLIRKVLILLQGLLKVVLFIGLNWKVQVVGLVIMLIGDCWLVWLMVGLVQWVRFLNSGKQNSVVSNRLVSSIGLWLMWLDSQLVMMKNGVLSIRVMISRLLVVLLLILSIWVRKNSMQNCVVQKVIVWLVLMLNSVVSIIFRLFYWVKDLCSGVLLILFLVFILRNVGDLCMDRWIQVEMFSRMMDSRNGRCQFQVLNLLLVNW